MARTTEIRTSKVEVDIDTITDAWMVVKTNVSLGTVLGLDRARPDTIMPFLEGVIVEWDGFDMPLSPESIRQLTVQEVLAITQLIVNAIGNP